MELKVRTKKWKNCLIAIIPKEVVKEHKIKPNQEITLLIKNQKPITKGKDIWGTMKFSQSTEELMREIDKDFGLE